MRFGRANYIFFNGLLALTNVCTKEGQNITKVLLRSACLFEGPIIHRVFHNLVENMETA
jgi:hypothetical protein